MAALEYVQLMASLPALGPILAAKSPPISALRLIKRLRQMLRPEHMNEMQAAYDVLAWSKFPLSTNDSDFVNKAKAIVPKIKNTVLRKLVHDRLIQRTVVAALRRREAGQDAPVASENWGYGDIVSRIRANWRDPSFGLGPSYKWILALKDKLSSNDSSGAERTLLEASWRQALRLAVNNDFDFDAVVIYVARWNLLDSWTRYDAELAAARFGEMVDEALHAAPQLLALAVEDKEAAA